MSPVHSNYSDSLSKPFHLGQLPETSYRIYPATGLLKRDPDRARWIFDKVSAAFLKLPRSRSTFREGIISEPKV